jgi:hypothetical protein
MESVQRNGAVTMAVSLGVNIVQIVNIVFSDFKLAFCGYVCNQKFNARKDGAECQCVLGT